MKVLLSLILIYSFCAPNILAQVAEGVEAVKKEVEKKEPEKFDITLIFGFDKTIDSSTKRILRKGIYDILIDSGRFNFVMPVKGVPPKNVQVYAVYKTNNEKKDFYQIDMELKDPFGEIINKETNNLVLKNKIQIKSREIFLALLLGQLNPKELLEKDEDVEKPLLPKVKSAFKEFSNLKKPPRKNNSPKKEKNEEPPLEEEEEVIEEPAPKKKKNKKHKPKKNDISNFQNSPKLDLEKEIPRKPKKVPIATAWNSGLKLHFGLEEELVRSESIAEIETTTNRYSIGIYGNFSPEDSWYFLNVDGGLGIIAGEHEYGFGPKYRLGGGYFLAPFGEYIAVGGGLQIDSFNYAAIFERGTDIKKSTHSGIWSGLGVKVNLNRFLKGLYAEAYLYNSLGTTATIGEDSEVPTAGTKTHLMARVDVYGGIGLGVKFESLSVSSTSSSEFSINDESTTFFLTF